jgi:lysophospholipase L1-like esterase
VFLFAVFLVFPRQKTCTDCVVLIGDSITSGWPGLAEHDQLSGLRVINRGAPGDSTAHVFSRFHRDVVRLHPRVVVILGGINDIAQIQFFAPTMMELRWATMKSQDTAKSKH